MIHITEKVLLGSLKTIKVDQSLTMIGDGNLPLTEGMILIKNSPLVPIFKMGFDKLRENGGSKQIMSKWLGKVPVHNSGSDTIVLGNGHLILIRFNKDIYNSKKILYD